MTETDHYFTLQDLLEQKINIAGVEMTEEDVYLFETLDRLNTKFKTPEKNLSTMYDGNKITSTVYFEFYDNTFHSDILAAIVLMKSTFYSEANLFMTDQPNMIGYWMD